MVRQGPSSEGLRVGIRCSILLISALAFAWIVPRMLQRAVVPRDPSTYTITVPGDLHADGSRHAAIYLRRLVADGREIPLAAIEQQGRWKNVGFALLHDKTDQPASITVRARTATVCFISTTESRDVLVEGSDGLRAEFDIDERRQPLGEYSCVAAAGGQLIEDRGVALGWAGAVTLVILALVAVWWQPWRTSSRLAGWAAAHVALLHVLVWLRQGIGYNADVTGYIEGIQAFAAGRVAYYPPGYSLFLAPFWLMSDSWPAFVTVGAQHVCMVAALLALRSLFAKVAGADLATLSLLLTGSVVPTLFLPQLILSENVAFCGMAGALWLASRPGAKGARRRDVLTGGLAGWTGLARVVPLPALAVPLVLVYIARLDPRPALTHARRTLLTAVGVVAVVASWNFLHGGGFAIANSWGLHLYDRVVTEQGLVDRDGPATRELARRLGSEPARGVPFWEILPAFDGQGVRFRQQVALLGSVALEGIQADLSSFVRYSFDLALRQYRVDPSHELWLSPADPTPGLASPIPLAWRATSVLWWNQFEGLFATAWTVLQWAPLVGLGMLPLLRGRLIFVALLAVPVGFMLAISQLEQFVDRFVLAVLPFALIVAPAPLAALLNLVNPALTADDSPPAAAVSARAETPACESPKHPRATSTQTTA